MHIACQRKLRIKPIMATMYRLVQYFTAYSILLVFARLLPRLFLKIYHTLKVWYLVWKYGWYLAVLYDGEPDQAWGAWQG